MAISLNDDYGSERPAWLGTFVLDKEALNLSRYAYRSSGGFGENEVGEAWLILSQVRHVWPTCRTRGGNIGHTRTVNAFPRRGAYLPKLGSNVYLIAVHISLAPHSWIGVVHATGGEAKTFGSTEPTPSGVTFPTPLKEQRIPHGSVYLGYTEVDSAIRRHVQYGTVSQTLGTASHTCRSEFSYQRENDSIDTDRYAELQIIQPLYVYLTSQIGAVKCCTAKEGY